MGPEAKKRQAFRRGMDAEDEAARYLEGQGYEILARRYKTKYGEVDLVALKEDTLAFIEVKSRGAEADALGAVDARTQKRIENAALYFLSQHELYEGHALRFDVIAVTPHSSITHLDNAWEARS